MKGIKSENLGSKSAIIQAVTISSVRVTKGAATVSPFNARRKIANPSFTLVRPDGKAAHFEFSVKAHDLGEYCWIVEASWHCNADHPPRYSQQPPRQPCTFKSRFEAVDDAITPLVLQLVRPLAAARGTTHVSAGTVRVEGGAV